MVFLFSYMDGLSGMLLSGLGGDNIIICAGPGSVSNPIYGFAYGRIDSKLWFESAIGTHVSCVGCYVGNSPNSVLFVETNFVPQCISISYTNGVPYAYLTSMYAVTGFLIGRATV